MTKSSEIKEKELKLKYEMEQLEKQHQAALVTEGKAYYCKTPRCKNFVDKEKEGEAVVNSGLCVNCFNRHWNEESRKKLMNKLKFGKIVNIELNGPYDIECITVYKNGMLYDLKAEYDRDMNDDAKLVIDNEYKDEKQYTLNEPDEEKTKPWQKKRTEKPILAL